MLEWFLAGWTAANLNSILKGSQAWLFFWGVGRIKDDKRANPHSFTAPPQARSARTTGLSLFLWSSDHHTGAETVFVIVFVFVFRVTLVIVFVLVFVVDHQNIGFEKYDPNIYFLSKYLQKRCLGKCMRLRLLQKMILPRRKPFEITSRKRFHRGPEWREGFCLGGRQICIDCGQLSVPNIKAHTHWSKLSVPNIKARRLYQGLGTKHKSTHTLYYVIGTNHVLTILAFGTKLLIQIGRIKLLVHAVLHIS